MDTPDMAAWRALTEMRARNAHLTRALVSNSETDSELAPCITVTPPPSEAWQWPLPGAPVSHATVSPVPALSPGDHSKLSPYDVQL